MFQFTEEDMSVFEVKHALETLFTALPAKQAVVILLVEVFNYSDRETADMIDSTEGAIKAALNRARKSLMLQSNRDGLDQENKDLNQLIQTFMDAFYHKDPMSISKAYNTLKNAGVEVQRQQLQGKMGFTFRDFTGNVFNIIAS